MSSSVQTLALKACRHFMVPVARFMLGIGVSYKEFAEISKLAFVQVASDEHGLRGRKTNMSRVSVMTGLNRKEIKKLRERLRYENWELKAELSKPVSVLAKWFTDPRYLGQQGSPKTLAFDSDDGELSFSTLVREIGGDVPPGAMLRELARAGCITEHKPGIWKAVKRQYSPAGIDEFQVQRFGECLHDLANTMTKNYLTQQNLDERLFEFRAWADGINIEAMPELKKMVASKGDSYLELVDDWLGKHLVDEQAMPDQAKARCGVGIYYFETMDEPEEVGSIV